MIKIFRITHDPRASVATMCAEPHTVHQFTGQSVQHNSHSEPIEVHESVPTNTREFPRVAPGLLVMDEREFVENDDMYYSVVGFVEVLVIKSEHRPLVGFNATTVLPGDTWSQVAAGLYRCLFLFRVQKEPATDVFCATGVDVSGNEFKSIYEAGGYVGLQFHQVWP